MDIIKDNRTTKIAKKLAEKLGMNDNGIEKCIYLVEQILNDLYLENKSSEAFDEDILNKCLEKYNEGIKYLKYKTKESEFFSETNINKLVELITTRLQLEINNDTKLICKTFVKIYMNVIYTRNYTNMIKINCENIEQLNKETINECEKIYKEQLTIKIENN